MVAAPAVAPAVAPAALPVVTKVVCQPITACGQKLAIDLEADEGGVLDLTTPQ